jgi:hypothetical protein
MARTILGDCLDLMLGLLFKGFAPEYSFESHLLALY